jgi:hypothetical protein
MRALAEEAIDVVFAKPDRAVVTLRCGNLRENILEADGISLWVDVGIAAGVVKPGDHFVHAVRHDKGMNVSRRLVNVRTFLGDPVVLQVVPASAKDQSANSAGVTMSRENALLADP